MKDEIVREWPRRVIRLHINLDYVALCVAVAILTVVVLKIIGRL